MTNLHMNVVTYVPKGSNVTRLESVNKLIPSIANLANYHSDEICHLVLNVMVNNSDDPVILNNLKIRLQYLLCGVEIHVYHTLRNNLMHARNILIQQASMHEGENFVTQFDDDDRILDNSFETIDSFMNYANEDQFKTRLNFFMFLWERVDGDWLMPKDLKSKPIDQVGKSTFSFSNWGWIAYVPYLINNLILYPEFLDSPYMDDNYFHVRSYMVNHRSNFILSPFYVWNNRDNGGGVSKIHTENIDKTFEYFKTGNLGYDADVFLIQDGELVPTESTDSICYPVASTSAIVLKGHNKLVSPKSIEFDYAEMRYRLNNPERSAIRVISTVEEFIKLNSTYQLRLQANMDPAMKAIRKLVIREDGYNGKVRPDSPYLNALIAEIV